MVLRKISIKPSIQIGGEINHSGPCDSTSFTGCLKPKNVLDCQKLSALLGIKDSDQLTEYHRIWVEDVLKSGSSQRDAKWTQSIAVGETKAKLGAKAIGRRKMKNIEGYELRLRESQDPYNHVFDPEKCSLSLKNNHLWQIS